MLAKKWDFPAPLTSGIADHYKINERMSLIAICVFTANQISKIKSLGFAGESKVETLPAYITDLFQMEMDDIITQLKNVENELDKARLFISV